ncbi:hypothetical protein L195_g003763 [Trifolium pratense]|uniref:Uncharacterized protein n=1 Tax=Trifolium pratense TaxID=57577 RepID=A0A2K3NW74_TRIPR|nr:hypothetical protein L195_g003763 [Trifolium pratense]
MLISARAGALPSTYSTQSNSTCPAKLNHVLHLQLAQLSLTNSSTFNMTSSARESFSFCMLSSTQPSTFSAQLEHELHFQHTQLSSTMSLTSSLLNSARPLACLAQLDHELHLQHV